jgi:hypothetical protein
MSTWIALDEFASIVGKSSEEVKSLCRDGMLAFKDEDGRFFIDVGSGTQLVLKVRYSIRRPKNQLCAYYNVIPLKPSI